MRPLLHALASLALLAPAAPAQAPAAPPRHTPADVRFMQGMIVHHAQALVLTALVGERAASPAIRLLAERIDVSQRDEIAAMRTWLADHGAPAEDPHAAHGDHAAMMPGMLSPAQLEALAAARGPAFDRLFLTGMIQHHEGALTMVADLLRTPGAAQESQVFGFASDVDADQRAEIARMRRLLATLPTP